jgi:hypothetical protein
METVAKAVKTLSIEETVNELKAGLKDLAYWADRVNSLNHAGLEISPWVWANLWDETNRANALLSRVENNPK